MRAQKILPWRALLSVVLRKVRVWCLSLKPSSVGGFCWCCFDMFEMEAATTGELCHFCVALFLLNKAKQKCGAVEGSGSTVSARLSGLLWGCECAVGSSRAGSLFLPVPPAGSACARCWNTFGGSLSSQCSPLWLNLCFPMASSAAFIQESCAALVLSEQANRLPLAATRSFVLKRLKPLSLFSWLFGKVNSDKCGINPLPACQLSDSPHCIGSKYLSPAFPLDMSVEDADTACELALWLEWYWLLWYEPFKFNLRI